MTKPTLNDIYSVMTDKQRRRCEMRWERRFSVRLIAALEGKRERSIYKSIANGKKRADKFYKNLPKRFKKGSIIP